MEIASQRTLLGRTIIKDLVNWTLEFGPGQRIERSVGRARKITVNLNRGVRIGGAYTPESQIYNRLGC